MPKRTKKLLVYLDQNFLSEISKAKTNEKRQELVAFTESCDFASIPLLSIEARLFAAILTRNATRKIQPSDTTDIDALSTYAPYMDIVCTDAFMANQLRSLGIDKEYGIEVFHARTRSLRDLKTFLEKYLNNTPPICRPSITVFVVPPKQGREKSFRFFKQLGAALRAMGINEYGEIYAFDDGFMPKYELSQMPGTPVPFYGLQDVTVIKTPSGTSNDDILKICHERCRSDYFVLIDEYRDIPETFMLGAAMSAESNLESTDGYRIYHKGLRGAIK